MMLWLKLTWLRVIKTFIIFVIILICENSFAGKICFCISDNWKT